MEEIRVAQEHAPSVELLENNNDYRPNNVRSESPVAWIKGILEGEDHVEEQECCQAYDHGLVDPEEC